ncbi:hypothetical protein Q7C36_000125 [Tachysurus vachellii]|uniref:Uncharacterized protein n=1 Tax=Tachysurus vachellii TaxID=175792 RepID=A0AA88P9D5_TACVA|nr:protein NCBP2AS2 [Tachysurus vachellii]KAK2868254.1 hypothetical protein Q7C36_000125 [Tachysurus vachellii]
MVLQRLVHALINHAQIVDKLAESRVIRRAAQLTAFAMTRAHIAGKDAACRLRAGALSQKSIKLRDAFIREVKDGMRDASRHVRDKK